MKQNLSFSVLFVRAALVFLLLMLAAPAFAEKWAVSPPRSTTLDEASRDTLADVVATEVRKQLNSEVVRLDDVCDSVECARETAAAEDAQIVVWTSVASLGTKLILSISSVNVGSGTVRNSERMQADRIEDLDIVVGRVIRAMASGKAVADTAEIGTVTSAETKLPLKRKIQHLGVFRMSSGIPVGDSFGNSGVGFAFHGGYWFEARHFAISPQLGVRFDISRGAGNYFEVPLDISGYYIFSLGDVAPYVGLGIGPRYVWERRELVAGGATTTDGGIGVGGIARGGVMLLRTYDVHVGLMVGYSLTVSSLNNQNTHQAFDLGIDIYF